jgi:hypothetical protein
LEDLLELPISRRFGSHAEAAFYYTSLVAHLKLSKSFYPHVWPQAALTASDDATFGLFMDFDVDQQQLGIDPQKKMLFPSVLRVHV